MKFKDYAFIGLLIVAIALLVQPAQQQDLLASSQAAPQAQQGQQTATGNEFGRLRVQDTDVVMWLIGGNQNPRTETVRGLYRRLGGRGNGTFADLLDQIGSDRWDLVQVSGNDWIFSRSAQN